MNDDLRYYGNPMNWESVRGDLISREELKKNKFLIPDIQFIGGRNNGKTIERITLAYDKGWNAAIDAIYKNAPAVEQPKGEWKIGGKTTHYYYCSICGKDGDLQDNFCRNCGAKMKESTPCRSLLKGEEE